MSLGEMIDIYELQRQMKALQADITALTRRLGKLESQPESQPATWRDVTAECDVYAQPNDNSPSCIQHYDGANQCNIMYRLHAGAKPAYRISKLKMIAPEGYAFIIERKET
jgi:hypothetical protein